MRISKKEVEDFYAAMTKMAEKITFMGIEFKAGEKKEKN